jgi:hypothetical protein
VVYRKIVRKGLIECPSNAKRYGLKGVWGRSGVVGTADIVLESTQDRPFGESAKGMTQTNPPCTIGYIGKEDYQSCMQHAVSLEDALRM